VIFETLLSKSELANTNNYINQLYDDNEDRISELKKEDLIKMVILTDLHIDYSYQEGTEPNCGLPQCCRIQSGWPKNNSTKGAGKWGDYQCDLNELTMTDMFRFVKDELKPDAVIWGGDSVPHDVHSQTFDEVVLYMNKTTDAFIEGLDGIPIFPTIGNHDNYPQDQIKMHLPKENPAINIWGPKWHKLLPDQEAIDNFSKYGYFSAPVTSNKIEDGSVNKIISLNNNICYQFNWESVVQFTDPGNMLGWLEKELDELEKVNVTAIIFSHVPNLDECNRQYGRRYHAIMDKYQTVIRFGVYGHIHQEQYQV